MRISSYTIAKEVGIRKSQDVNAALLTKLGCKVIHDPDNTSVKVVSAKHLTKYNFFEAKTTANGYNGEIYLG